MMLETFFQNKFKVVYNSIHFSNITPFIYIATPPDPKRVSGYPLLSRKNLRYKVSLC